MLAGVNVPLLFWIFNIDVKMCFRSLNLQKLIHIQVDIKSTKISFYNVNLYFLNLLIVELPLHLIYYTT